MEAVKRVLVVVLPLLVAYVLNRRFNTRWQPVGPVVEQRFEIHTTRGAYSAHAHHHNHAHHHGHARHHHVYLIAGGAGFTGSWIARYLLLRGEKHVHLLDRVRPPADVIKHGATYHEVDLADPGSIEPLIKRLEQQAIEGTPFVVYNCCVVKRYWAPNFRVDLGVSTCETLFVALRLLQKDQVTLVHVGDTLAHRQPIKNLDRVWPTADLWNQTAASDTALGFGQPGADEGARDRAFSSYSWHQLTVERLVLQLPSLQASVQAAAVLRTEGFVTGHVGDSLIVPCVEANRALLHSPHASVTLVHVEDVARGCLSLEHALMDPATRDQYTGKQFTVGSAEVTTMQHVFDYVRKRRPAFRIVYLEPVLVFLVTWIVALVSPLLKIGLVKHGSARGESLFQGVPYTLTFGRFYTLQAGQVPNKSNIERQRDALGVENNFSLSQTLDMICDEVALLEKREIANERR